MDVLPIELIITISSSDPVAFVRMIKADRRVYQYVLTPAGRNQFLVICMQKRTDTDYTLWTYSLITGKLHSFFDKPALVSAYGGQDWWEYGNYARMHGSAILYEGEGQLWFQNGKCHREHGPAIAFANGNQYWIIDNKRHRVDGPAITRVDGTCKWYLHGKLNWADGPAIIYASDTCEWWLKGLCHRVDGPAITHANGKYEWWINGVQVPAPL